MIATGRGALSWLSVMVALVAGGDDAFAQTGIDAQENVFGATNVNATTGHGRLTAGISRDGDVTVLSWPSPSYGDQLGYRSSNALDARSQPRFGAAESAGIVLGLFYENSDASTAVTWLRDRSVWTIEQDYGPDDGGNPHTRFSNASLGLEVTLVDAIDPSRDALVREVTVRRDASSGVQQAWLLTFANLSPVPPSSRVPELPIVDWIKDGENDFAAIWDEDRDVVVHFHPGDRRIYDSVLGLAGTPDVDWGPLGQALTATTLSEMEVSALVDQLDGYGEGVWVTLGTVPAPDQHQIGFDATPFCPQLDEMLANMAALSTTFESFDPPIDTATAEALLCKKPLADLKSEQGWIYPADDAWQDAQDGDLSGADVAAGEVAEALRTPLTFGGDGQARAAVVLGLGGDRAAAQAAFDEAAADPTDAVSRAAETVASFVADLRIPGTEGERPYVVARRSLLNLRVGTDAETGAIVASIARQPPYGLDWPRDGAFFNVMLDASGQSALVDQRVALYAEWQRSQPVTATPLIDPPPPPDPTTGENTTYPADAWEMNYFADGLTGGTFRFEIDTTAFAVWAIVAHVGWVGDPEGYLREHWDAIRRGADLLARWKDPETGLHAPAQEDDAAAFTQTLHGAISVFGALDIAARAARLISEEEAAEAWESRAGELKRAMRAHFYDEEQGVYVMSESERLPIQASGLVPVGPTAWLVWPFPLYPLSDPQIAAQLERDHAVIEPAIELENEGGLYYMKNTISIALAGQDVLGDVIPTLAAKLAAQATPDTDHFGEVMVVVDEGGSTVADQRVSTPHLWEGTLYYLTALATESPEALLAYDAVLPPSQVLAASEDVPPPDEGCGCRFVGEGDAAPSPVAWPLLVVALGLLWRRRVGDRT